MKKPLHHFLIIATALSASLTCAQNPSDQPGPLPPPEGLPHEGQPPPGNRRDRPGNGDRSPQSPFGADRRDEPRRPEGNRPARPDGPGRPEGRDFDDGAPPRPDGDRPGRPMLGDRLRNRPAPLPQTLQPYLGVVTRALEPALSAQLGFTPGLGLIVEDIVPDGPAAKAGIQAMDVIKQVNDQLVSNPGHLAALVRHFGKDADVTVLVLRKGQEQKIAVKIGERLMPDPANFRSEIFGGMPGGGANLPEIRRRMENQRRNPEDPFRAPRDPQSAPEPLRPRPSADILREVGPGGAPEVQVQEDQVSTTWNTSSAKVMLKDQNGSIEVRSENGKRTLTAKNPKGDTVFDGPIDTEEQRKAVPEEFRKMLDQVEVRSRGDRRPGPPPQAGSGAGAFAPRRFESDRFKPPQRDPEVQ